MGTGAAAAVDNEARGVCGGLIKLAVMGLYMDWALFVVYPCCYCKCRCALVHS